MKNLTLPRFLSKSGIASLLGALFLSLVIVASGFAAPVPGGTLDPLTIPKYVTPLVIPPVMDDAGTSDGDPTTDPTPNNYDIAVRQFKQQILPGGIWDTVNGRTDAFPATTVWSYGPAADPTPAIAPDPTTQFNYPAYTVENISYNTTKVDWINDLKDPATGEFLPHILPIDRTLHWANPEQLPCMDGTIRTDCRPDPANGPILTRSYDGPVPIITHVHGAHVGPESDGYPEAWYLPDATNIPAGYATQGTLVNQYSTATNTVAGVASFSYPNSQPSTTLWYHDHTLGMTRTNVYAGPAGFWLIRAAGGGETGLISGTLPGPAPVAGDTVLELNAPDLVANTLDKRSDIREIPIVIQDRSFNADGSLFYPGDRAFFEGVKPSKLKIPFIGDPSMPSDISPIWNPEAFFNVMVVNGVSWPVLEVEPDLYRFRLLNGCNSRFLNLSLRALDAEGADLGEVPIYQIGAEQSLLPYVVKIETGTRTILPGDGNDGTPQPAAAAETALLMGLAERADVLVDFSDLPEGTTRVRMINTAPDAPFGGFPDVPADPDTTGQVMEFSMVPDTSIGETFTPPEDLVLSLPDEDDPANAGINGVFPNARDLALLEEESELVCVTVDPSGKIQYENKATPDPENPGTCIDKKGLVTAAVPFAPKAAVLGIDGSTTSPIATLWADPIVTNPAVNTTETWELWNHTEDGHPIHLHLVKFKVVNREAFDEEGTLSGSPRPPEATEIGWKDTVIAYPGEVTRLNATFDIEGLYVWHCHIVEHEDNEMMVPYCVGNPNANGCQGLVQE